MNMTSAVNSPTPLAVEKRSFLADEVTVPNMALKREK